MDKMYYEEKKISYPVDRELIKRRIQKRNKKYERHILRFPKKIKLSTKPNKNLLNQMNKAVITNVYFTGKY